MSDNLGLKHTWTFFRCLLDPGRSYEKAMQQRNVNRIFHKLLPLQDDTLVDALKDQYLTATTPTPLPSYTGGPNPTLDIPTWEVKAAMQKLRTSSASGANNITNKMLRVMKQRH